MPIVLCGEGGLARLVPAGKHTIRPVKGLEGPTCALIALGAPATVSSKGLQWDMGESQTSMTDPKFKS